MINKTLCEHCIFKVMVNGKQIQCKMQRLEHLPHHEENNHFVIDTFCSACRNVYWEAAQEKKDAQSLFKKVRKEIEAQFDAIIVVEPEDTKESLLFTLDSIKSKDYTAASVYVTAKLSRENEALFRDIAYRYNKSYNFMMSMETELPLRLAPIISKSKSPYLIFVNPGHEYDEEVLEDFDITLNDEFKPKILYASEEFYICPRFLYEQFMYEKSPFQKINEYVQSVTASKRSDS